MSRAPAAEGPKLPRRKALGSIPRHKGLWLALLVAALALAALAVLFPWYASAYLVERAGRMLDSNPTSEGARATLLQAIGRNPRNAQAYRLLAYLDTERGDGISAADDWAHFVTLRPADPQGYWSLAAACERLAPSDLDRVSGQPCGSGETDRPQALIELWRSAGQSAARFVRAGDTLRESSWDEAMEYYKRALLLDPQSVGAWNGLGTAYRSLAREDLALDAYARAAALSSDPEVAAAAHAARGEILAQELRWSDASAELEAASRLVPEEGKYRLNYGRYLYEAGGDREIARFQLHEAARLLPSNPWPHVYLAILAFAGEEYETALEEAHTATALDEDLFWAWLWRGKALAAAGRLREAEDSLRRAVRLAPEKAEPHAELGLFLGQALRLDDAISELEQAVRLAPNDLVYRFHLAGAYYASGQTDEAIRVYRQILEMDPGNAAAEQALVDLQTSPQ